MAEETISVPGYIEGDFCCRYRGPDLEPLAIKHGDMLVLVKTDTAPDGALVITLDDEDNAELHKSRAGLKIAGRVTGVMRRIDDA